MSVRVAMSAGSSVSVRTIFPRSITLLTAETARSSPHHLKIKKILNELGLLSAESQGLKHSITTFDKLVESDHKIYLAIDPEENDDDGEVVGFLKLGEKRLFVTDGSEPAWPANIQCVLDFYICAKYQRHGWGRHLFEHAIENEDIEPWNMAYDRPSEKLINFLAKYYRLTDVVEQPNRYVMYRDYFINTSVKYVQGR
ncbi:alpha-tubulin N-acetyltransferase-like isoform X2 [Arctopsyche grandis]